MKLTKTQRKDLRKKRNLKTISNNARLKPSSEDQAYSWNKYLSKTEYTTRKVTFGKYVNVMIKDIPNEYLEWGCLNLNLTWSDFFIREWKRRNPSWRKQI
jgi:hypothetical protein